LSARDVQALDHRRQLCVRRGADRQPRYCHEADVIFPAEIFCGLSDSLCWLAANGLGSFEAEEFALAVGGFDNALRNERQSRIWSGQVSFSAAR
jgi:hypothetical protein